MADPMNLCTYSPQIVPGNVRVVAMRAEQRPITRRDTVVLQYPINDPSIVITLKAPNLNNKMLTKISRIQRMSRGGELICFRDPLWTEKTVLNWAFEGLNSTQAQGCLELCSESCGDLIQIVDYESRTLQGILMNPNNPISQEKPDVTKPDCLVRGYTWKMDFIGDYV